MLIRFYLLRLQAISAAQQLGSVQLACRMLDIPRSTFYRWRRQWLQYGREILSPRERREPRIAQRHPALRGGAGGRLPRLAATSVTEKPKTTPEL